jgi:hypothetical protein
MSAKPKLTDDDLALAWFACGHAASFWKSKGQGAYARKERAKYDALSAKLDRMIEREPAEEDE